MDKKTEWIEQHQLLTGCLIVVFFLFIYFIGHFINRPKDAWLYVSFINEYNRIADGSRLYEDTKSLKGAQGKRIVFDTGFYFDLSHKKDYTNSYYQKLVAYIEAETTDAIIGDKSNIEGIATGGRLLDLRDKRVADKLKDYSDRFYYLTTEENEIIPVAVSLSGTRYAEELGYKDEVYVGIASTDKDTESAVSFINLLLD